MVLWQEEAYTRTDAAGNPLSFGQYVEQAPRTSRWQWMTKSDAQLYAVTGAGFFLDSYDLFIVNLVTPIWTYEYWGGLQDRSPHYPPLLRGLVNAAANLGNIVGQLSFGYLGDTYGRRFVYGNELIIGMVGIVMCIALPNSIPTPNLKMAWIFCWRFVLGIGIGGDYPISAAIMAERAHLKRRGRLLGWIFSNQGWGNLTGSIITLILLACFSQALSQEKHYGQLDAVWRLQIGLALIPALITLYPRLTMPEGRKYLESRELNQSPRPNSVNSTQSRLTVQSRKSRGKSMDVELIASDGHGLQAEIDAARADMDAQGERARLDVFLVYFREWRHLKTLIGTASAWFLLDVAFYGTNLNQSVILSEIGYSSGKDEFDMLRRNAIGNIILAVAGYVPGYFVTIYFIERLGRRWIQIQGFLITALLFAVLAGGYHHIGTAGKFVCLAFTQFFFNFGANTTTFILPAEVFPSRVRAFAHGASAAAGKTGAILSALLFNYLSGGGGYGGGGVMGLRGVLWVFASCCLVGAGVTVWAVPETRGRDADAVDWEEWLEGNIGVVG
ncbi:MAG: hypothetical protein Q9195_006652 [Heterodermia aff. obscurata]